MMNRKKSILYIIGLIICTFNTVFAADDDTTAVVRKKAEIDRSELLTVQEAGEISLREEDDGFIVDYSDLCSVNEGTMVGIGGNLLRDTYLSEGKYGGIGFRFMNERMKLINGPEYNMSKQHIISVDLSSTMNGAQNANYLSAFVNYSYGVHYRFLPDPYFKILLGGNIHGMLGTVYNTRNGNNPMTLHADVDLNLSVLAIYEFRIKNRNLALRYQIETPFLGVMFSPEYDQSYYAIFSLGETSEIIKVASFHNKRALRNYLTLDFPVSGWTVRAGYFGNLYFTHINQLERSIVSNNFMVGFVKEFVAFGGR
ncbi:MAG: DUF3316 domain-containing protein, partial [Tannerella sp.]|nr:DUF3316 domain-containing protein [Tannerella sp.]